MLRFRNKRKRSELSSVRSAAGKAASIRAAGLKIRPTAGAGPTNASKLLTKISAAIRSHRNNVELNEVEPRWRICVRGERKGAPPPQRDGLVAGKALSAMLEEAALFKFTMAFGGQRWRRVIYPLS